MTNKEYLYKWIEIQNKCLNNPFIQRYRPNKGNFIFKDDLIEIINEDGSKENIFNTYFGFKQDDIDHPIIRKRFIIFNLEELDEFYGQCIQDITTWSLFGKDSSTMRTDLGIIKAISFNTLTQKGLSDDNNS